MDILRCFIQQNKTQLSCSWPRKEGKLENWGCVFKHSGVGEYENAWLQPSLHMDHNLVSNWILVLSPHFFLFAQVSESFSGSLLYMALLSCVCWPWGPTILPHCCGFVLLQFPAYIIRPSCSSTSESEKQNPTTSCGCPGFSLPATAAILLQMQYWGRFATAASPGGTENENFPSPCAKIDAKLPPESLFLSLCSKIFEIFKLSWRKLYKRKHLNLSECLYGVHFMGCKLSQTSGKKNEAVFLLSLVFLNSNNWKSSIFQVQVLFFLELCIFFPHLFQLLLWLGNYSYI